MTRRRRAHAPEPPPISTTTGTATTSQASPKNTVTATTRPIEVILSRSSRLSMGSPLNRWIRQRLPRHGGAMPCRPARAFSWAAERRYEHAHWARPNAVTVIGGGPWHDRGNQRRWRLRGGVPARKPHLGECPLCIEHRRLDVIGPGREQVLAIGLLFVVETPTTNHDLELRTLRTQALAEVPRLAQASWGHRPDANERGAVQVDPGEHFGGEHPGPARLDPIPHRVEQVSHHLESHGIGLVSSGTRQDPNPGIAGVAHGEVPGVPPCWGRTVV